MPPPLRPFSRQKTDQVVLGHPSGETLTYTYDGGLVLSETAAGAVSGTVSWSYDEDLRVESVDVAGAGPIVYGYDDDDLPTAVGPEALTWSPTRTGLLDSVALGTVGTELTYDSFGSLDSLVYTVGTTPYIEIGYSRDAYGRISSQARSLGGVTSTRCYEYDDVGRLVSVRPDVVAGVCAGVPLEEYAYDANSNRSYSRNNAGVVDAAVISVDDQDRLIRYGGLRFSYTANGELDLREDLSSGEVWDFDYDVFGNLVRAVLPAGDVLEYVVDARNRRVGKRRNGGLEQAFLYGEQLNPVAELDGLGNLVSRFVYGSRRNVPDYMVRGGVTYRFVTDHLGSVLAVVDVASGHVVQQREYDTWGRILSETTESGFSQPFGFAGGLWDEEVALVRFGARDYDPGTGRWTSKDPLLFWSRDFNVFGYVAGDPVNRLDVNGLEWYDHFGWVEDLNESAVGQGVIGFGDTVGGIPFTSLNVASLARSLVGGNEIVDEYKCDSAYLVGEVAGVVFQLLNAHPKLSGWLFGRAGKHGGLLNRWDKFRVGWNWKGPARSGNHVLRVGVGPKGQNAKFDIWSYPRGWWGGT